MYLFSQVIIFTGARFLHPVKEPSTRVILKLEEVDPSSRALGNLDEISFTREDDEILDEDEREREGGVHQDRTEASES